MTRKVERDERYTGSLCDSGARATPFRPCAFPVRWVWQALALLSTLSCLGSTGEAPARTEAEGEEILRYDSALVEPEANRNWSVQFGVAFISKKNIDDALTGDWSRLEGDAGGQLYSLMFNYTAHRFAIPCGRHVLRPRFEPYLTLTLVDENNNTPFMDYNGGVGFRWADFPWNRWVATTFFMGIGLSYSTHVYRVDRLKHPGEERSHLKFDWPIQFTLAVPRWPQHQLVVYIDHQSGGHVFDEGGVNSFGFGYRFEF